MGLMQTAVQQAVEQATEQGTTFGDLLALGPDGLTPMHLSPDALLDALLESINRESALQVNPVPVNS